ncbi:ATP-binding protein [Lysinibacter sp. HNR]|uniref:sensor histidine kinase n=1 Tax=Lysinibacter sp. HNR TaxID=3031408 RepID=UPI002434C206|nr:ATP-binding protein [Lysinibacter sp. HNR]WGD38125.1 ATP-binding protein [Lysinibacter sp. HNR]
MESVLLVLLSLALGLVAGVSVTIVGVMAARRGRQTRDAHHPTVPTEVADVVEAIDSFAVILDSSLNIIYTNSVAQDSELIGEELLRNGALQRVAASVLDSGETVRVELRDEFASADRPGREDGVYPPGNSPEISGHNLWLQGTPLGPRFVFIVVEDRGEAWRLESVRRDFIANVSHELKTPVSAVALLVEAIQEAADDPEAVIRFAKRLGAESDRLVNLVSNIIQLSAAQQLVPSALSGFVEVRELLKSAVEEHQNVIEQRNITLVTAASKNIFVAGDEKALVTALSNLVGNAIKYSDDGSRVGVGVTVVDSMVEIAITDQGVGIPAEDADRIFERFYRVDPARSRQTGGTGLGLSIVKNTVQGHGGLVRVWSRPGAGSTFTIVLPLRDPLGSTEEDATAVKREEAQGTVGLQAGSVWELPRPQKSAPQKKKKKAGTKQEDKAAKKAAKSSKKKKAQAKHATHIANPKK